MKRAISAALLGLLLSTLFFHQPGSAQPPEELRTLRQEIEALKEGQRAIRKELQEIKKLLQPQRAQKPIQPTNVLLHIDDRPFKGDKIAAVTLVDFSDFQ
jgi:hypothetical protein